MGILSLLNLPLHCHPTHLGHHWAELPVLHSNLLLAICFIPGSVYMLLSQFISPSPSLTVLTCLFESIFLKGEKRVWPIFSSVAVSIDSGRGSWMFEKWNDLNQYLLVNPMERSRNAWVLPSWAKLQGCGPKRLKLFNTVSSVATHCSAYSRCSTNIYETSVRIAPIVHEKIWNGSRGGGFTFTKHQLCASLLTCIVSLICIIQLHFTQKENEAQRGQVTHPKSQTPPQGKVARWSCTLTLISSTLSPVFVLTPFCDPTHISWPPWAFRNSKKTSFSLVLDSFLGWSSIPLMSFPILSCAKKNSPRLPPTLWIFCCFSGKELGGKCWLAPWSRLATASAKLAALVPSCSLLPVHYFPGP